MSSSNKYTPTMSDDEVNIAIRLANEKEFGVISASFLSQSIAALNPKKPLCISHSSTVKEVLDLLQKYSIGSVLIVDDLGKLKGIFTERDSLLKVTNSGMDVYRTTIDKVMTINPETQKFDGTIASALNLMSLGGFRHVPIVDDEDMPVGIISVKDVVDCLVHKMNEDLDKLTEEEEY